MAKIGRKQKPYESTNGKTIPGLAQDKDGRWRIIATGQRFTETDEQRAIAKAKKIIDAIRTSCVIRLAYLALAMRSMQLTDHFDDKRIVYGSNKRRKAAPLRPFFF